MLESRFFHLGSEFYTENSYGLHLDVMQLQRTLSSDALYKLITLHEGQDFSRNF
jgi:hypothetical protein